MRIKGAGICVADPKLQPILCPNTKTSISSPLLNGILQSKESTCRPFVCEEDEPKTTGTRGDLSEIDEVQVG